MSEQVTEIAYIPLVPGLDLTSGDHQKLLDDSLKTISSQPGCKSLYWGRQIENPDTVQLVIDWDNLDSHKAFMSSPTYGPFLANLKPLLSDAPKIYHIQLPAKTPFSNPASAPVTECISLYFPPDHSTSAFDANYSNFAEEASKVATEMQGVTGGWGIEEHTHEKLGNKEGEEGPARLFGSFIGWPSVEAHMEFRKHEGFPGVIKYLRDGPKALAVHHVEFQKY